MQNRKQRSHDELREKILSDKAIRRAVTRRSHRWFFSIFLSHYITYEAPLFHQEMFKLTEDKNHKLIVVMAFRGSGKSTLMNLSYALWSILGIQQKKFVLIISKTQGQAKTHFLNIRDELRHNALLSKDLGPFETDDSSWGVTSLVLPKMGARITVASSDQAVRGIRFWQHRPDLIICDDLEDSTGIQSQTGRDSTYEWFMSEVMLAGSANTKVIVLGNLLHEDSLLMRLHDDIVKRQSGGVFKAYPIVDDNGRILWPGKYDSKEKIEELELSVPDENTWEREYKLAYVPEAELTEIHEAAKRLKQAKETGVEAESKYPTQILGPYRISAPRMTFTMFSKLNRHWVERFAAEVKTKPTEAIESLRIQMDRFLGSWTTVRLRGQVRYIISTALQSSEEKAQQEATVLVKELVDAGYKEFGDLLTPKYVSNLLPRKFTLSELFDDVALRAP